MSASSSSPQAASAAAPDPSEPMFKDISAEDPGQSATEVESMCVNCQENGVTRLLLVKIPHYKEVILMSFACEHCGFQNNEIQSGGRIQEQGIRFNVKIENERDLSRQVVKTEHASLKVPEIELEVPTKSQEGAITTVEGILERTITALEQDQPVRRHMDPDGAKQIDDYVLKIRELLSLKKPFHIILSDPSGNSFVENLRAPLADPARDVTHYVRSTEENHALAIYTKEEMEDAGDADADAAADGHENEAAATVAAEAESLLERGEDDDETSTTTTTTTTTQGVEGDGGGGNALDLRDEVLHFQTNCPECNAPATTNMKVTSIPYFKEVVIMATVCDYCDHKTNEVKSGGGIEQKGTRITLKVTDPTDLSRDVLKSETCRLLLPELDFDMGGHALGGRFTTLEGLLMSVLEQLESNPFVGGAASVAGDSAVDETKKRMAEFRAKMLEFAEGKKQFVVVMDDPAGNSYLQNVYAPEQDPEMTVEHYERSYDQNEELGLNDMKTENYGEHLLQVGGGGGGGANNNDLADAENGNVKRGAEAAAAATTTSDAPPDKEEQQLLLQHQQRHLYVKDDKQFLSPAHSGAGAAAGERRVSASNRSAKSNSSGMGGANAADDR